MESTEFTFFHLNLLGGVSSSGPYIFPGRIHVAHSCYLCQYKLNVILNIISLYIYDICISLLRIDFKLIADQHVYILHQLTWKCSCFYGYSFQFFDLDFFSCIDDVVQVMCSFMQEKIESATDILKEILKPVVNETEGEVSWPPRDPEALISMEKVSHKFGAYLMLSSNIF